MAQSSPPAVIRPVVAGSSGGSSPAESALATSPEEATAAPELAGFVDLNAYYDSRESTNVTIGLLLNLPLRLQYFAFVNLFGPTQASRVGDQELVFSEQNLRWRLHEEAPLDVVAQYVIRSGPDNDVLRLGLRWRFSATPVIAQLFDLLHLRYGFSVYAFETDFQAPALYALQIEHVYKLQVLPEHFGDRVYIAGFIDHNIRIGGAADVPVSRVVTEHQLGIRVVAGLHIVAEFRFNEYMAQDQVGVGLGLQYLVPFRYQP